MTSTSPNRNRTESAGRRQPHKQSGDQHILPEDDTAMAPHRPHRSNREDMQKHQRSEPDRDDADQA